MEKIDFRTEKIPFTQVANTVLNNQNLSFKAKGLYAYLYSKPDGWNFEFGRIAEDSNDGIDSVRSAINELEEAGYLVRTKTPSGRMIYSLSIEPIVENPRLEPIWEKPRLGKTQVGKIQGISNKEYKVIKRTSNKDSKTGLAPKFNSLGAEIIKGLEMVDPKNKTYYNNKTQRTACDFLIDEFGLKEVLARILLLQKTNKTPYFPTITTPVQLRDKWVQLETMLDRYKQEKVKNSSAF